MQPETKEKPAKEQNGRQYSPTEEWELVAFQLILKELAPKGFKEINHGPYRGKVVSNIPFLPKESVHASQKAAAQLVRAFRQKAKNQVSKIISELDNWLKEDQAKLKDCRFWEFSKKMELKYKIRSLHGQAGSAQRILTELDNIPIK